MIIEFRLANYRSVYQEQTFSFVASKDTRHPQNLIPLKGYSLLKATALYGANASGKSNLTKAIAFMKELVVNSATRMNAGDPIQEAAPFRLASNAQNAPCLLEMTFLREDIRYTYGFTATRLRVHDEWLRVVAPGKKEQVWMERRLNLATGETAWAFQGPLQKEGELLQERTRDNALALSTGSRENIKSLLPPFQWFREKIWLYDLSTQPDALVRQTSERCQEDRKFHQRILALLQGADMGIEDFSVKEEASTEGQWGRSNIQTQHRMREGDAHEPFDMDEDESNGTRRFFAIVGPFLEALEKGALIVVDELDCSMHPLLTRKLLELFQSPSVETRGAQLLFTTHDTNLLDPELLRRDQIWLVEKRQGASEFYSLHDFDHKPRSTEAFERNYLAGRYGGIPLFGPALEDLVSP